MEILFLGTGAADWDINGPRDGEFRRFSSALIDGTLLIDPGPCVLEALDTFDVRAEGIKYIINTHPHMDHFNSSTVTELNMCGADFIDIAAGDTVSIGDYRITAFAANHSTCNNSKHFLIEKDGKRIFYALDGAWLMYDESRELTENGADLIVLDATIGDIDGDYRIFEHNNLNMVREIKSTLAPHVKRFIISHMARTLHTDHKTLCENMAKSGIEVAFDGFKTKV